MTQGARAALSTVASKGAARRSLRNGGCRNEQHPCHRRPASLCIWLARGNPRAKLAVGAAVASVAQAARLADRLRGQGGTLFWARGAAGRSVGRYREGVLANQPGGDREQKEDPEQIGHHRDNQGKSIQRRSDCGGRCRSGCGVGLCRIFFGHGGRVLRKGGRDRVQTAGTSGIRAGGAERYGLKGALPASTETLRSWLRRCQKPHRNRRRHRNETGGPGEIF